MPSPSTRTPPIYSTHDDTTTHNDRGMFIDTTATFDESTDEFIIDTPHAGARKNWISFAATHAKVAVVFARLLTGKAGGEKKDEGVHAFLLDVRDDNGTVAPGVTISDMGQKPCINGNDNAQLSFDHVRVPRGNLLDRCVWWCG